MLALLKLELGISETDTTKDALLTRYLDKCNKRVEDFTRQSTEYVTTNMNHIVIDLSILMYNRRGTEGTSSQSASGMSESYIDGIPRDIKKSLYAHRKMVR